MNLGNVKQLLNHIFKYIVIILLIATSIPLHPVNAVNDLTAKSTDEGETPEEYAQKKKEIIESFVEEEEPQIQTFNLYQDEGLIENDYLSIYANDNGQFTMGTTGGNPNIDTDNNKILTYAHPGGTTSYTTVRINGQDYRFQANVVYVEDNKIISTQEIDDVTVKQILSFEKNTTTNREDIGLIRYEIINNGDEEINAGTRIMIDTMLGHNDGAPFRVPGLGDVTVEKELTGSSIPQYWQAFDHLSNPNVVANGTFYKTAQDRPDKVQFASWPDIYGTDWNYETKENNYVTRDSAVAIYHNPKTIRPHTTRVIQTYYGIGDFAVSDTTPPLSVRITAPEELVVDQENASYYSNPFTITGYVQNIGDEKTKNTQVTLDLPQDSGLQILSAENATLDIGDLDVNEEEIVTWTVLATSQSSEKTVDYSMKVQATDVSEKEIPLSIILPKVEGESTGTIEINKTTLELSSGETETLEATLNGITSDVTWISDNVDVATIDNNGKITAKSGGTANIIVTAGGKVAYALVVVNGEAQPIENISFANSAIEVPIGQKKRLQVQFTPENAANKRIKSWTSSKPFVAKVTNGIVEGLSEGTSTITAISEDGSHVASIDVTISVNEPGVEFNTNLSFAENIPGPEVSVAGKDFALFNIPFSFEIGIDKVKFTYEEAEDKYIGYFGDLSVPGTDDRDINGKLTPEAFQARKDVYKNVKKLMNGVGKKTNKDFYNSYRSLTKKDGPLVVSGGQSIFGTITLVNVGNDRYAIGEGELVILHQAGYVTRFRIPPVPPLYAKFGLTGEVQSGLKIELVNPGDLSGGLDFYGTLKPKLTLEMGIGAGQDFIARAEAGLNGSLDTEIDLPFNKSFKAEDDIEVKLTASAYLEFQALLFLNSRFEWKFAEAELYPGNKTKTNPQMFSSLSLDNSLASEFELMPRTNIESASEFIANYGVAKASIEDTNGVTNKVLKKNVFAYGTPTLSALPNGDQIIVWVDDDVSRTDANHSALYYSVHDGSTWSEPKQVDDDGTADFAPQTVVHNDELYLVWQNVSKELEDDVSIDDMFAALDISIAKFVDGKFIYLDTLTEEGHTPISVPKIASNGEDISVVWLEGNEFSFDGLLDDSRIVEITYTDEANWDKAEIAEGSLSQFDLATHDGKRVIAYSSGDQMYLVSGNDDPVKIAENEKEVQNPRFTVKADQTEFYWHSEAGIQMMNLTDKTVKTVLADTQDVGPFGVISNDNESMIYFEKSDGYQTSIHGIYQDQNNEWGKPIQLVDADHFIRDIDGMMKNNGDILFVYNTVAVEDESFKETDMVLTTIKPFSDLALLSNVNFDLEEIVPGQEVTFSFDVGNVGQQLIEGINISLYDSDGVVHTEEQEIKLISGEEEYVEFVYQLPEELSNQNLRVEVLPIAGDDVDLSNNDADIIIGQSNLEVSKPEIIGQGNNYTLKAEVTNTGYDSTENITVNYVIGSEDGEVVSTRNIDLLAAQTSKEVEFNVDVSQLQFAEDSDDILLYVIVDGEEHALNGNHLNFTKFENPYHAHPLKITEAGIAGNNVLFTVNNNLPENVEGNIIVQTIGENVKETLGQIRTFNNLYGESLQLDISDLLEKKDPDDLIRLFIVNEDDQTISNTVEIGGKVIKPQANPEPGTYQTKQSVVLYSLTEGAEIYYTEDGSDPTSESRLYDLPIQIAETTTIKAVAVKEGKTTSDVVELEYIIEEDRGSSDDQEEDSEDKEEPEKPETDDDSGLADESKDEDEKTTEDEELSEDENEKPSEDENPKNEEEIIKEESKKVETPSVSIKNEEKAEDKKLPKTATYLYNYLFIGIILVALGFVLHVRRRRGQML